MYSSACRLADLLRMVTSYAVSLFLVSLLFVGPFFLDAMNWSVSDLVGAVFALGVSFALIAFVLGLPVLLVAGLTFVLFHDEIAKRLAFWCAVSPVIAIVVYAPIDFAAFNNGAAPYGDYFFQRATIFRFTCAAGVAGLTAIIFYIWTARLRGCDTEPGI